MRRGAAWVLGMLWMGGIGARAQTAEVTIYSHGSWASELKPVSRNAIFTGVCGTATNLC